MFLINNQQILQLVKICFSAKYKCKSIRKKKVLTLLIDMIHRRLVSLVLFSFIIILLFLQQSSGSGLYGPCFNDTDCGTIDTYCKKGSCACREHFTEWTDTCIELANPRVSCTRKHECHSILGSRSICTRHGQCACKPFHHLYNGQCVKNRDLYDICEHDHQCYCGKDCGERIACINKNCTCSPGNTPYKIRRCISNKSPKLKSGYIIVPLMMITNYLTLINLTQSLIELTFLINTIHYLLIITKIRL